MNHRDRHQPSETRTDTVTLACGRSGPERVIEEYNSIRQHTLADVEAWTAKLRELGAPDDLPLKDADGLVVTLDAT